MSENKKAWNDRIKLILNELECKINEENSEKIRKRPGINKKKQKLQKEEHHVNEEDKQISSGQEIIMRAILSVAFLLATAALIRGVVRALPGSVTVSNSVNGRELPIYCVETDKKQIALSFDAAWGN